MSVKGHHTLCKKCCLWCIAILRKGLNINNIQSALLVGGMESQKEFSMYALDDVDNSGRSLNKTNKKPSLRFRIQQ